MVALPSEGRAGKRRGAPGAPRSAGNGPGRRAWERRERMGAAGGSQRLAQGVRLGPLA